MADRPLSHIRVLDFGHFLAGPLVGMMLADMGAQVIRIDPPGGPAFKNPATDMLSRGKSSLVLDLKTEAGRTTAIELAKYVNLDQRLVPQVVFADRPMIEPIEGPNRKRTTSSR